MPSYNRTSDRIKFIRAEAGMKQKEFAGSLGISQGYLSEIENGSKQPSDTLLLLISNLFSINPDWLSAGKGEAHPSLITESAASYAGISRGKSRDTQKQIKQFPNEAIKSWIDEFWANASEKERAWFEIEFERAFQEFKEWRSKRDAAGSVTRKKILPDSRG